MAWLANLYQREFSPISRSAVDMPWFGCKSFGIQIDLHQRRTLRQPRLHCVCCMLALLFILYNRINNNTRKIKYKSRNNPDMQPRKVLLGFGALDGSRLVALAILDV
jgi:hypothetical protein